jgi:hypothetical protein
VVGVVGGFLVVASSPEAFESSVDAEEGRSLDDTREFREATRGLPSDRLALFFMNLEPTLAALRGDGFPTLNADDLGQFGSPAAAVAYLRPDGIVFEGRFPGEGGSPGEILAGVPSSASGGLAVEDLAGYIQSQLEIFGPLGVASVDVGLQNAVGLDLEDDLLSWIGGFAFYFDVGAPEDPVIVLRIESQDPDKSRAALQKIQMALIREGFRLRPRTIAGLDGFEVRIPAGGSIVVVGGEEAVTLATNEGAALTAVETDETFRGDRQYRTALDALGQGFSPAAFVRVGPVLDLIGHELGQTSAANAAEYEDVRTDIDPFSFIIYGSRQDGDRTRGRLVIGVE